MEKGVEHWPSETTKSESLAIEVRREEHEFVTHNTKGGSLQDMPSHCFPNRPFSWEANMDGANQNWTQKYLTKAHNHSH